MSYFVPDSWRWGSPGTYYFSDKMPGTAVPVLPPVVTSTSSMGAGERFWRQIRLIFIGLVGVAAGVGSLALYRHNSDLFLIVSTAFTLLYTLLTLFSSLRSQSPYTSNVEWNQIIEALSYFQLFNTFFVMLCVADITFKTKSSRSGSSQSFKNSNNNHSNGPGGNPNSNSSGNYNNNNK